MRPQVGAACLCFALLTISNCGFAGIGGAGTRDAASNRPAPSPQHRATGTVLDVTGRLIAVQTFGDRPIRTVSLPGGVPPEGVEGQWGWF